MQRAKFTLAVLMLVLMLSIFVANVANIIDSQAYDKLTPTSFDGSSHVHRQIRKYDIADSNDHLLWYLQVNQFIF